MGLSIKTPPSSSSQIPEHHHIHHKLFLLTNYAILGLSTSCIFLTLSLRLLPSWCGLLLILLHALTIASALTGCSSTSLRGYAAHMVSTVVTAIFQGSVSVLVFASTSSFLANMKSYVREEDGAVILKLAGGLCVVIFCLEWVGLGLAFVLRFRDFVENGGGNNGGSGRKVVDHEDTSDWPWPFQV